MGPLKRQLILNEVKWVSLNPTDTTEEHAQEKPYEDTAGMQPSERGLRETHICQHLALGVPALELRKLILVA
jgi:hypothetical protein